MTAADLFTWNATRGIKLRDAGMARAAAGQETERPWAARAYAAIEQLARTKATVHIDDVLLAFRDRPEHPNAWGAVWMKAFRNHVLVRTTETRPCLVDPGKHCHQYPVYKSLLWNA